MAVFKRGKSYYFVVDIGIDPKSGKRKQKKKGGFKSPQEAKQAEIEFLYEWNKGIYVNDSDILFKDFTEEWLEVYISRNGVKPATIRSRQNAIKHLNSYLAHYKVSGITRRQYQGILNDLKKKHLKQSTIISIQSVGRMIFAYAKEVEIISKDPTEFSYIPKEAAKLNTDDNHEELPKFLESDEVGMFFEAIKKDGFPIDYPLFLTLVYSGMRPGELRALQWPDIDFVNNSIRISKTVDSPTNKTTDYELVPPKNKTSNRTIKMEQVVMDALKSHQHEQKKYKFSKGKEYHDNDFVFANQTRTPGYPVTDEFINTRMRRILKIVGLNQVLSAHSFRHTHTSLSAEAGISLSAIQSRLGHASDKTTEQVYLHTTKRVEEEASKMFGEHMKKFL